MWWAVLAGVQIAALAGAPSYYSHYSAFVAPALCLLLGAGVGQIQVTLLARGGRLALVAETLVLAVVAATGLGLVLTRAPLPASGQVDHARLTGFAAQHECVWVRNPSYLQLADATARQLDARCPASLDLVGDWLVLVDNGTVPGTQARTLDAVILEQLTGSDGALLAKGHPTQGFGSLSRAYLAAHFEPIGSTGEIQMWTRSH